MGFLGEVVILYDGIILYCYFMVYDLFLLFVFIIGFFLSLIV